MITISVLNAALDVPCFIKRIIFFLTFKSSIQKPKTPKYLVDLDIKNTVSNAYVPTGKS